jgi:hypothetical protein
LFLAPGVGFTRENVSGSVFRENPLLRLSEDWETTELCQKFAIVTILSNILDFPLPQKYPKKIRVKQKFTRKLKLQK